MQQMVIRSGVGASILASGSAQALSVSQNMKRSKTISDIFPRVASIIS